MNAAYRFGVFLHGDASSLAKAAKQAEDALKKAGNTTALTKAARDTDAAVKASGARSVAEFRRMAQARETLGIRSEHVVQREIQRTQAAYSRLARSGTLSWTEQRMAAGKMREEVTKLVNEMGKLTKMQKLTTGGKVLGAAGAGVGVSGALLAPKINQALDFDTRARHLTNTAYAGQDRRAGYKALRSDIDAAVMRSGLGRDGVMGAAETLYGSGVFNPKEVQRLLGDVAEASVANRADPEAFASLAAAAKQTMRIQPDRMRNMFGIATYGGQQGGFEIKDMARHLPDQMGAAKSLLGMSGESGFAKLVALNQAARTTAGTADAAGINVQNLLSKMGAEDTVRDFRKHGVDLRKEYAQGAMRGEDAVDVLGKQMELMFAKDPNLRAAREQLKKAAPGSEREAALDSVTQIAQGSTIAKVFQDRQALSALLGYMNDPNRVNTIARDAQTKGVGAVQENISFLREGAGFKTQERRNQQELDMQTAMDKLTPTIGGVNDWLTKLMQEYPGYVGSVLLAKDALLGLAAAAGALALMGGGKALLGAFGGGKVASGSGLPGSTGAAAAGGRFGRLSGAMGKLGLVGAAAGLFTTSEEEMKILRDADRKREGHRGRGFTDPRLIGSGSLMEGRASANPLSLSDRLTPRPTDDPVGARPTAATLARAGGKDQVELLVRVSASPGTSAQAEVTKNPGRIPFRTDAGRTNTAAGF